MSRGKTFDGTCNILKFAWGNETFHRLQIALSLYTHSAGKPTQRWQTDYVFLGENIQRIITVINLDMGGLDGLI